MLYLMVLEAVFLFSYAVLGDIGSYNSPQVIKVGTWEDYAVSLRIRGISRHRGDGVQPQRVSQKKMKTLLVSEQINN